MIILDKPFVSDLLKETISRNKFTVLESGFSASLKLNNGTRFLNNEAAVIEYNAKINPQIYSNSENAINWISTHLNKTCLPNKINLFKDKVKFRELIKDIYPDFFFKEIDYNEIESLKIDDIPKPFIIKPSVGFFSMGVYKVYNNSDWENIPALIKKEIEQTRNLYPAEVMNPGKFIIEQMIEGDEFAFDVYFNNLGKPVVLGIFKHLFSSGNDVSDRVYYSSKEVIEKHLQQFTNFAKEIGKRAELKNFPMHVEVRINNKGELNPIEVNPMRFGGWCTTADLTTLAYNLNPYEYYFKQKEPDWKTLLKHKKDLHYCMIILDNSTGYKTDDILDFNYNAVLKKFNKPLDLRKTDWNEYPIFGILFTETHTNNYGEIESILKSDLKEFVSLR